MDKADLIAQYEKILGGKFFPESDIVHVQVPPETEPLPANANAPGPKITETSPKPKEQISPNEQTDAPSPAKKQETKPEWIPQLKKVVEFSDTGGKKHLVGLENYTSRSTSKLRSRAEQQPFKEYAILLKAVVDLDGAKGTRVNFVLELQSETLRDIFRAIAKPYAELNLDSNPIVIDYPFRCLFSSDTSFESFQKPSKPLPQLRRSLVSYWTSSTRQWVLRRLSKPTTNSFHMVKLHFLCFGPSSHRNQW